MDQLFQAGIAFRAEQPEVGSELMRTRVRHLIELYNDLEVVHLSDIPIQRVRQIKLLSGMMHIKRLADREDWGAIGRSVILYGPLDFSREKQKAEE